MRYLLRDILPSAIFAFGDIYFVIFLFDLQSILPKGKTMCPFFFMPNFLMCPMCIVVFFCAFCGLISLFGFFRYRTKLSTRLLQFFQIRAQLLVVQFDKAQFVIKGLTFAQNEFKEFQYSRLRGFAIRNKI